MTTGDPMNYCDYCKQKIEVSSHKIWLGQQSFHYGCYTQWLGQPKVYIPELSPDLTHSISFSGYEPELSFISKPKRKSWHQYFIELADLVSTRSTCDRKHCGSVIVKDNKIIATGYNGSEHGKDHCDDVGHFMVNSSCKRTIHAEINALKFAKEILKTDLKGCILYTNTFPCLNCFVEVIKDGIKEIYYKDEYRNNEFVDLLSKAFEIKIEKVEI